MKKELSLTQTTIINAISKFGTMFIQVIISMVLARLILPAEYGVIAILTVLVNFFSLFAEMGLSISVVQKQEIGKEECEQLFTFSFVFGLIFSIMSSLAAVPMSMIYDDAAYLKLCPLISIVALINSVNAVPNAMLCRDKKFDVIAIRSIACAIFSGVVTIILAYLGWGVYALVANAIINALFVFVWNYSQNPLKLVKYSWKKTWALLGNYSLFQLIFSIVNYFTRNLDSLIIGAKMGDSALGYYNKAYTLNLYPNAIFTNVVTSGLHPYIRDYNKEQNVLMSKLTGILKILSIIAIYVMIVCFWCSSEIIVIMYGEVWAPASQCFKALSICIWAQMLSSVAGSVFLGIERTDQTLKIGIFNLSLIIASIFVGIYFQSINAISLAVGIAYNIIFVVTYFVLVQRTMKESFWKFFGNFKFDIVCATVFMIAVSFIKMDIGNVWISLIIKVAICTCYYLIYLLITKQIRYVLDLAKKILGK